MHNQFIFLFILFFVGEWYKINGKESWVEYILDSDSSESSEEYLKKDSNPSIWAVLVAGSNDWYNYRHQADVLHAYHVLKKHGIKEDNIITMVYDDIAHNKLNPYPGKIYNVPHGINVYEGVKIDYKGDAVTPENFLAVLEGDRNKVKGGNGRVVESTKEDKIFVFFSDHGAVGMVSFPTSILTVKDLNEVLNKMHNNKRYKELTFYLEACESGSMFEGILSKNINVYAITAANSHESSWGCFCDNDMKLPCLGDTFSVSWILNSEAANLNTETLNKQYEIVKKLTNMSHVMHYGDLKIAKEYVSEFQGHDSISYPLINRFYQERNYPLKYRFYREKQFENMILNSVMEDSRDIPLIMIEKEYHESISTENEKKAEQRYLKAIHKREYLKKFITKMVKYFVKDHETRHNVLKKLQRNGVGNVECHHEIVHFFHNNCFNFNRNAYAMKYVYVLSNLCDLGIEIETLKSGLFNVCQNNRITNII
uniref:legumain n=1 Tax=Strongyloides papillosus TaxID=174720 RepID=A0A0N5C0T1_STREA